MNMFDREARDIVAYLERHGYTAAIVKSTIEVLDPIQVSHGGGEMWLEHKTVRLNGWPSAIRFVEDRS